MRALGTPGKAQSGECFLADAGNPNPCGAAVLWRPSKSGILAKGKFDVGYGRGRPFIARDLRELDVERPAICKDSRDLLIRVKAVGVNPIDFKERIRGTPICGYDAAGIVEESSPLCAAGFKAGDEVWYMGSVTRQGANADFHLVDERLVSKKPENWSFAESAAMPLCLLTAWECFEDRLGIQPASSDAGPATEIMLISPGAGGLGSAAIQLAKSVFNMKVVATASRNESIEWCKQLGADLVISHHGDLKKQLVAAGWEGSVDYILSGRLGNNMDEGGQYLKVLRPYGKVVTVDAPGVVVGLKRNFDFGPLFSQGIQLLTHFVFSKAIHGVKMESQGAILSRARQLVENERLKSILHTELPFTAEALQRAHAIMENGSAVGKVVLAHNLANAA